MATLPTVPSFDFGDTSILKLQQLGYCVSFLADCDVRPVFHAVKTQTASITGATWTTVQPDTICIDSDGVFTATVDYAIIQTQGVYRFEATVPIKTTSTSPTTMYAGFELTVGANNPNESSGDTIYFGMESGATVGNSTTMDTCFSIGSMCPITLYPADKVAVRAYYDVNSTIDILNPGTYLVSQNSNSFSGYFVKNGT